VRKRKHDKEEQTFFAKQHYALGSNAYLSDDDKVQFTQGNELEELDTSNKMYSQYIFNNNQPLMTKRMEVKSRPSEYVRKMIKGEIEPSPQMRMFSIVTEEQNGFRKANNLPPVKFYLVIETNNNYPIHVYNVVNDYGKIRFEFVSTVNNVDEYKEVMKV
jgi:hypothetical protein